MTSVLSAHDLGKSFGAVVAASGLSMEVPAGQRVSLIGSNGAGKTTFVNMVTGYLKPDSGRILLEGRDITALAPRRISRMGVSRSFQIPQLCIELTALENMLVALAASDPGGRLSFWKPAHADDQRIRAEELLDRFGLAEYADRPVTELPGGVRKLLDIAMALTGRPRLLLLDEPTSGVSAEEKFPMMETVMGALARESVTVLFVEHDMDIVTRYADRVVAFFNGRIIADDPPDRVLDDPEVQRYVTGSAR
ncbi:ABC transporter ATP-binding protein [Skermanella sp. TT6]|uniref:ABC transporter ATP-binding protein n=1 Tax=Skermanella cutis TaxID=2775420 RepID=A0ABX7BD53_9PROT|nr:ABC transporter ATP-binding protein [Skermanella sp. TT6]QQP91670.1 ABC transporter ATP-binding protein [Skermanella sp. TT6]